MRPPRCAFSHSSVGSAARMRRSSLISPPCIGTLKSTRTSTERASTGGRSSRTGTPKTGISGDRAYLAWLARPTISTRSTSRFE